MREFNLEAAKRGEPIVCRDGTPAKFVAHVLEAHPTQRLVVLVGENIFGYMESGSWTGIKQDHADLFMATKKRTVWINIYGTSATVYCSEQDADKRAISWRIGNRAYPVEVEE